MGSCYEVGSGGPLRQGHERETRASRRVEMVSSQLDVSNIDGTDMRQSFS